MYEPNIEHARKRFIERVALAYFQTWAGYGYVGKEYSYEEAVKTAERLADSFPKPEE